MSMEPKKDHIVIKILCTPILVLVGTACVLTFFGLGNIASSMLGFIGIGGILILLGGGIFGVIISPFFQKNN